LLRDAVEPAVRQQGPCFVHLPGIRGGAPGCAPREPGGSLSYSHMSSEREPPVLWPPTGPIWCRPGEPQAGRFRSRRGWASRSGQNSSIKCRRPRPPEPSRARAREASRKDPHPDGQVFRRTSPRHESNGTETAPPARPFDPSFGTRGITRRALGNVVCRDHVSDPLCSLTSGDPRATAGRRDPHAGNVQLPIDGPVAHQGAGRVGPARGSSNPNRSWNLRPSRGPGRGPSGGVARRAFCPREVRGSHAPSGRLLSTRRVASLPHGRLGQHRRPSAAWPQAVGLPSRGHPPPTSSPGALRRPGKTLR